MSRALAVIALGALLAASLLAGCGGDSDSESTLSADEYRSQLDQACTTLFDGIDELSAAATGGDLDAEAVQQRSDEISAEFESAIAQLEPPEELADAHEEMIDLGDEAPKEGAGVDAFIAYGQANLDAFEALGASQCVAGEQDAVSRLEDAS